MLSGKNAEELRAKPIGQCSKDTPLIPKEGMPALLESVPAWSLDADSRMITRSFVAKNFLAALDFFKQVAVVAEEANHHPDLHLTGYRNVEVVLTTHAAGGLSMQDFIMAARIDALPVEYSPKWLKAQEASKQQA